MIKGNQISLDIHSFCNWCVFLIAWWSVLMPLAYLTLLGASFISKGLGKDLVTYIMVPASGFVLLTLVRKWINQPRPYEAWEIIPLLDKDSAGNSMPSRHVFSATIIPWLVCTQICLWAWFCWSCQLFSVWCESWVAFIIPRMFWLAMPVDSSGEFFSLFSKMQSKWAWPRNHLRVKSDHLLFCPCKVF